MLLSKIAWTLILAAVLLVPLWSIESKISERQARALAVAHELAETGVGDQSVAGPVIVVPCTQRESSLREDEHGKTVVDIVVADCTQRHVARQLGITGALTTEVRKRGIYRTLFYAADLTLDGTFDIPAPAPPEAEVIERRYGAPELRIGITDVRGIDAGNTLRVDGAAVPFAPGSNDDALGRGIHATLPALGAGLHRVQVRLPLRGTSDLQFLPLARDIRIDLRGAWPHPSFYGRFLPRQRSVDEQGFEARWQVSELASDAVRAYLRCAGETCAALHEERIGVSLIEPVDLYAQSLRAVDYGFLFVGLTFLVFLLFEFVAALRLHAVQYALVGLALAVFFLLLFALAEHIAFELAYVSAAGACIALIGFYVSHVLGSVKRAAVFCGYLLGLDAALYMLLRSEDSAILLGALLVFAVLAITMVLTRRIDWHAMVQERVTWPRVPGTRAVGVGPQGGG